MLHCGTEEKIERDGDAFVCVVDMQNFRVLKMNTLSDLILFTTLSFLNLRRIHALEPLPEFRNPSVQRDMRWVLDGAGPLQCLFPTR